LTERLIDDAIALREALQGGELFRRRVGIEFETEPDLLEADGRILRDSKRPPKIQVAFGTHGAAA